MDVKEHWREKTLVVCLIEISSAHHGFCRDKGLRGHSASLSVIFSRVMVMRRRVEKEWGILSHCATHWTESYCWACVFMATVQRLMDFSVLFFVATILTLENTDFVGQ